MEEKESMGMMAILLVQSICSPEPYGVIHFVLLYMTLMISS